MTGPTFARFVMEHDPAGEHVVVDLEPADRWAVLLLNRTTPVLLVACWAPLGCVAFVGTDLSDGHEWRLEVDRSAEPTQVTLSTRPGPLAAWRSDTWSPPVTLIDGPAS